MDDTVATENNDDDSSDNAEANIYTAAADEITPYLREAHYSVIVGLEYPNKPDEETAKSTIKAYAKIAGKRWTYYVKSPAINIGRSPDGASRPSAELMGQSSPGVPAEEVRTAHIDLGPNKLVSRIHASVYFENEEEKWCLLVNGRNGVRINDTLLKIGEKQILCSGDIIEIGGTEMIFVAPDVMAVVHDRYRARLGEPVKQEEMASWNANVHSHPELPRHSQSTSAQTLLPAFTPANLYTNGQTALPPPAVPQRPLTPSKTLVSVSQPDGRSPYDHQVSLESNEKIDYSSDAMKDHKPPCSYATLISQAILSNPAEKMSLANIYMWIKDNFSYYRHLEGGWQNSIRHNLSLNSAFQKVPRSANEPGKGSMWYISEEKKEQIRGDGLKMTSRGGARRSSAPNSPAPKKSPKKASPKSQLDGPYSIKKQSPVEGTSPLVAFPTAQESYTPSRGSRISATGHTSAQELPQLSDDASPLPSRPHFSLNAAAAGSPPTLSSSAFYNEDQQSGQNLFTPMPRRFEPRPTEPSTVKLPSQYLPQSSPAPFWKFNGELGSTLAGFPESSPLRPSGRAAIPIQSSSPPPIISNGSPTRTRGVPADVLINGQVSGQGLGINGGSAGIDEEEDDGHLDLMGYAKSGFTNSVR